MLSSIGDAPALLRLIVGLHHLLRRRPTESSKRDRFVREVPMFPMMRSGVLHATLGQVVGDRLPLAQLAADEPVYDGIDALLEGREACR